MDDDEFPTMKFPTITLPNGVSEPEYPAIYLNIQNLRLGGFLADFAGPLKGFLDIRYDLIFAAPAFGSEEFYFGLCLSPRDNLTLIPNLVDIQNVGKCMSRYFPISDCPIIVALGLSWYYCAVKLYILRINRRRRR